MIGEVRRGMRVACGRDLFLAATLACAATTFGCAPEPPEHAAGASPAAASAHPSAESAKVPTSDALAIPADASLIVLVRDPSGAAVRGATVTVRAADEDPPSRWSSSASWYPDEAGGDPVAEIETDAWGRAVANGLGTAAFVVAARAPGRDGAVENVVCREGEPPAELVLTLRQGASLAGRVTTTSGAPVRDAIVAVTPAGTSTGPGDAALGRRGISAADGTWTVGGLSTGRFEVWTRRQGDRWQSADCVRIPDVRTLDLVVPDGGEMTGRVVDAVTGATVAGAEVTLWKESWPSQTFAVGRATTDGDGRYCLRTYEDRVEFQSVTVSADAWSWVAERDPGGSEMAGFVCSGTVARRDFVVQPAARIGGVVTGPAGPVARARVRVFRRIASTSRVHVAAEATTDAAGRWSAGGLSEGVVAVSVTADGLRQPGIQSPRDLWPEFGLFPDAARRTLRPGEAAVLDFALEEDRHGQVEEEFEIAGVLRDPDGMPIARARVLPGFGAPTYTRDDGTFTARFVAHRGWGRSVTAWARGFVAQERRVGRAADPDEADRWEATEARKRGEFVPFADAGRFEFRLRRAPAVRGRVTSALGLPVEGALVRVARHQLDRHGSSHVDWFAVGTGRVGPGGAYQVDLPDTTERESVGGGMMGSLLPEYAICIEAEGHAPQIGPSIRRVAGTDAYACDLVVGAGATLSGRVVSETDRRPVADEPIVVSPQRGFGGAWNDRSWPPSFAPVPEDTVEAVSGDDGTFVVALLTPGAYSVRTAGRGHVVASENVALPAESLVELRVEIAHAVSGVVCGPDGSPTRDAQVWLEQEGEDPARTWSISGKEVGLDGTFRFDGLRPGRRRVRAEVRGDRTDLAPAWSDWITGVAAGVAVRMPRGLLVSGRVADADGVAVAGVSVECRSDGEAGRERATETGADGRFRFGPLGSGHCTLTLPEAATTVRVDAGETVDLAPPGRFRVAGRLVGADGDGHYPWVEVHVRPLSGGDERVVRSDGDGRFACRFLDAGEYELTAEHRFVPEEGEEQVRRLPPGTRVTAGSTDLVLRLR